MRGTLRKALQSLSQGDWAGAHRLVQDEEGADAAWVHAHLHRVEGDGPNAAYWYRRAGRPVATGSLDAERERIVAALAGDQASEAEAGSGTTPR